MTQAKTMQGRIIAAHGRHYTVEMTDNSLYKCFPKGKKTGAAVGDFVTISSQAQNEGVIDSILDRRNLLYRSDDMRAKLFAANVDQLFIVVAVEPAFSVDLIGRALVAARNDDIDPVIILNKIDIATGVAAARKRLADLSELGTRIIELSSLDQAHVRTLLLPELQDCTTLLLGQSAMGKSTLLNALVPEANAHTQEHSVALGAGKHTTTSTRLYHVPHSTGHIIDSPGFQTFGLYHLNADDIQQGFPEFAKVMTPCRFYNCTHRHEPGCEILAALKRGEIAADRHQLYQRILAENKAMKRY